MKHKRETITVEHAGTSEKTKNDGKGRKIKRPRNGGGKENCIKKKFIRYLTDFSGGEVDFFYFFRSIFY